MIDNVIDMNAHVHPVFRDFLNGFAAWSSQPAGIDKAQLGWDPDDDNHPLGGEAA